MKIRRWTIAGVVAATLLTPGLTACNSATPAPFDAQSAAPAIPADPKEALLASTKEIAKGNFRFAVESNGMNSTGSVHMPSRSAQMSMKAADATLDFSMEIELIYVEPDSYVKMKLGGALADMPEMASLNTGKYMHLDQSKVKSIKDLQFDFNDVDPAGAALLTKAIVDVQKTGEGTYSGKIDLSKATEAGLSDEDVLKALGAQANSLPFTAKLDAQGRLTELAIKVPAVGEIKEQELKVTYSDYGAATATQKPEASQTQEAPAGVYEMWKD
ncbi:hypothetical protein GCM10027280_12740 [Micromonospora polyrhachis]|uniref:Lipoprotein n=1 Tax=Micromonospora polyrhachis TaxID=1282883 RepID=A0A7W7SS81_9ACTN|nr:hypothetical protein [Micromonospora polyrhachis]MBB4960010.1 hypothetical protein [Micromonospora polyrhachis]